MPGTGLSVGTHVPNVHARDMKGRDTSLAELVDRGPLLLVFYRGGGVPRATFAAPGTPNPPPAMTTSGRRQPDVSKAGTWGSLPSAIRLIARRVERHLSLFCPLGCLS